MRKKIYETIEPSRENASLYDMTMMIAIIASIVPLFFKETNIAFLWTDRVTVTLFIIDYLLRWMTADCKLQKGILSFIAYPFTPMAIIDLLSILPVLTVLHSSFRLLRVVRLVRMFRIFRVFKVLRYSKNIDLILRVINKEKDSLIAVIWIAFGYIIITALLVFNIEPQTFDTFFDALYWSTVSLTTVGYGDIYPVSDFGRIVSMVSSVFGIAVVALPAGIITAGLMDELKGD